MIHMLIQYELNIANQEIHCKEKTNKKYAKVQ